MQTRHLFLVLIAFLLGLWFFASNKGCSHQKYEAITWERPNDPWVFRSVLDTQPRMITMALHPKLWASYSTEYCALYKAWNGTVNFDGTVWNMRHGPQPTSVGPSWFVNRHQQPWRVTSNGKTERPKTDYKGHRLLGDGVEIFYDLVLASGERIRINEQPEFIEKSGQIGFSRVFRLENVPKDAQIQLLTNVGSIAAASNIETDGTLKIDNKKSISDEKITALDLDATLTLNEGTTHFATYFVARPFYTNPFDGMQAEATAGEMSQGERLINQSDCKTCHNAQVQTVGPSYVAVAKRYKNTPTNIERLAEKVIKGGSGVYGIAAMSAHPDLSKEDVKTMISYILDLDEGEDEGTGAEAKSIADIPANAWLQATSAVEEGALMPGLKAEIWQLKSQPNVMADIDFSKTPTWSGKIPEVDAADLDFGKFRDNFAMQMQGYLYIEKDDNFLFQLNSDDGCIVWLDGQEIINDDGLHGARPIETELALRQGFHPIKVRYFQGGGGRSVNLKWASSSNSEMQVISSGNFSHNKNEVLADAEMLGGNQQIPGDGSPLLEVHPSFDLSQARPNDFLPKVAGMDFLSDGRLVVSTWDPSGGIFILENVQSGDPNKIKVKQIARGLAEPLGLKVVDDTIYVLQKQELTQLIDTDGDGMIDEYRCFAKGWRASANFHEFAFGLAYKDGYFYGALAIAILPGGASKRPQITDRGKIVKISKTDGSIEFIARGLRTPNTVGVGVDGELFVADNQGDWLPACKILHIKEGAFYNSFAVDSANVAHLPVQQPVVWLPQDEIGNSASQMSYINHGPYKGQMIHGEVTHGGVKRVFVEKIDGNYQGCVFRFIQGLEAGINRMVWGPDSALYVGGIGNPGNWGQTGKLWYGLQRLAYNGKSTFEILAVRAKTNGIEIEFTEKLPEQAGWNPSDFTVQQWWYKPTINYGGPKMDEEVLTVKSATRSESGTKVFLEIDGIKAEHVVYLHLNKLWVSQAGHELLSPEAWYTMNAIPTNAMGVVKTAPNFVQKADNQLSTAEKAAGWVSLFDGKSLDGWRNFRKENIGSGWIIDENAIHLNAKKSPDGNWQSKDGGDILWGKDEFQDFELELDWKIGKCGNSGIIYFVQENENYDYVWQTGPEMQVLDNSCHPDAKFPRHRAGDLYDLKACKYEMVKPAGEWNHVRLVSKNGHIEHWLNGRKLVDYEWNGSETKALIAKSKFTGDYFKDFAKKGKGKIALQDHGDPVWFKNIKVRR